MIHTCKKCPQNHKKVKASGSSWLSALLIIVIPKCPFCIMAYSSAITMCGGADIYLQGNNWVSYIPIFLSLFIIGMLLMNYRDSRTKYALTLAMIGLSLVLSTHQMLLSPAYYYYGTAFLILSIWLNGSLFSILGKLKSKFGLSGKQPTS